MNLQDIGATVTVRKALPPTGALLDIEVCGIRSSLTVDAPEHVNAAVWEKIIAMLKAFPDNPKCKAARERLLADLRQQLAARATTGGKP